MSEPRRARLRALAKINLDLRVLGRRPDGYHELRTVFQTISLADRIDVCFEKARTTRIELAGDLATPDNLIRKAAAAVLDSMRVSARVELRLKKGIPIGAGLGGGSSDAAAVLLALPVLAGTHLDVSILMKLAAQLGSDVPFFLLGGTAVAMGRGTELYPVADLGRRQGILVASGLSISTAAAYAALGPCLTSESQENKIFSFQSQVWSYTAGTGGETGLRQGRNDFETVIFEQFPKLASIQRKLRRLGALPARMTGSGSAVFGLFENRAEAIRALESIREERVFPISFVGRRQFRALWWRALRAHAQENIWPPRSRYER